MPLHFARLQFSLCTCACASALLSGCATPVLESRLAGSEAGQLGLLYALPKGQVQLVAERKRVSADAVALAKKNADDAAAVLTSSIVKTKEADGQAKDLVDQLAALKAKTGATASAIEELERRGQIAQAVREVLKARQVEAKVLADEATARAKLVVGEVGNCSETATLAALPHAPDIAARWLVNHAASVWRDDQLTIGLTPHGLLSSSNSLATDQTAAVILSLAQGFAASRAPSPQGFRFSSKMAEASPDEACKAYKTTALFDPTRRSEVQAAAQQLKEATAAVGLCVEGLGPEPDVLVAHKSMPGYAYRAAKPVRVTVTQGEQSDVGKCAIQGNKEAASLLVTVPDTATLFVTPVEAATFTKVSNKHTFKDGMLIEVSLDKPSTGLALASLPIDILKALISVPASMLKLRVDYETQSAALATQQANVLKAQLDLLEAQKKLEDRLAQPAAGP